MSNEILSTEDIGEHYFMLKQANDKEIEDCLNRFLKTFGRPMGKGGYGVVRLSKIEKTNE